MQLIQSNVYFNHQLHILNYITYVVGLCVFKITEFVAVPCMHIEDNTVLIIIWLRVLVRNLRTMKVVYFVNVSESSGAGSPGSSQIKGGC